MRLSNAAVEILFRDEHKSLRRVTRRKINHQDSEDITQEAFLRLLEVERSETIADPRSYLFRIGLNVASDWLRKERTRASCLVDADGIDACSTINMTSETPFDDWLALNAVLMELSRLSDRCRDIFLLSRIYQLTNAEIAAELGISVRTVNRNIGLATEHLHSAFGAPATQKKSSSLCSPILQQKLVFVAEAIGNGDRNIERRNPRGALLPPSAPHQSRSLAAFGREERGNERFAQARVVDSDPEAVPRIFALARRLPSVADPTNSDEDAIIRRVLVASVVVVDDADLCVDGKRADKTDPAVIRKVDCARGRQQLRQDGHCRNDDHLRENEVADQAPCQRLRRDNASLSAMK